MWKWFFSTEKQSRIYKIFDNLKKMKSDEKWWKVMKSDEKWWKVMKSDENITFHHFSFFFSFFLDLELKK